MAGFQKTPSGSVTEAGAEYAKENKLSLEEVKGLTDLDIEGLRVIQDNRAQVITQIGNAIVRAIEAIGIEAEGDAKEMCPVDTGRLRNSITHALAEDGRAVMIGTNVEYAEYQEMGTSRQSGANGGRGFLRPAVTDNIDKYQRIFEAMMKL